MEKIVRRFLKYLLFAVAAILLLALVAGCVRAMAWPWWVGVFLTLIALGLCAGAWLVRKLVLRRREQNDARRELEREEVRLKKFSAEEQSKFKRLRDGWRHAVETLRRSHLKSQGDPLYVLPWYLVMGESGSGKTSAIEHARLSSPLAQTREACEEGEEGEEGGTRDCRWSFLEQAILIDTAGRYTVPVEKERDQREWQKVLSLILKYRKREPLNGLVVTVAADRLLTGSTQDLENYGRQLRQRIDELMRVLGIKFPVYVLITKCDLIGGMTRFTERLSAESLNQPMGEVNEGLSSDAEGVLERFLSSVGDRLKWLRLLLVHGPQGNPATSGMLLFPEQFEKLKPGLAAFVHSAFQENRYQDTPLLRGIYLGGARQQTLTPAALKDEVPPGGHRFIPGADRGLFLHDFFEKVLPRDRGLLAPTSRTREWLDFSQNLGLAAWVSICLALCGLLSYSFVKNMSTMKEASAAIAKSPESRGGAVSDLAALETFRQVVLKVEQGNLNWWIPRFGLNESREVEATLKARFCRQFRDRYLAGFDRNLTEAVAGFSAATPDELSGRYLLHLCRRINLLKARLDGAGIDRLRSGPLPSYQASPPRPGGDADGSDSVGEMYLNYLVWRGDDPESIKEVRSLQSLLKQAFTAKGGGFDRLVELVNRRRPEASVTLQSFWGGSRALSGEPVIAPAFTRKGQESVAALANEIVIAYPESGVMEKERGSFEHRYRNDCFAAWQAFASAFPKGEGRLNGAKEWQSAAAVMAGEQGAYARFVRRATLELEPFGASEALPPWLSALYQFQALKTAGLVSGKMASAAESGKRIAGPLGNLVAKKGPVFATMETQISSENLTREYAEALAQIGPAAKSRSQAQQIARQVFGDDSGSGASPFFKAADRAQKLNSVLAQGRVTDETFSRLLFGPIAFYGTYLRQETACALQRQWEENVLKEVQGASDPQTLQYLLSKDGPVWKFVATSADPFIGWNPQRGYYSKTALGGTVPFEPAFYAFLTKGAKAKVAAAAPVKQSYDLAVKGLPTDANGEASMKPQKTHLELQCAAGPQVVDNLNYPVNKTIIWSPDSCGDVVFQIEIGDTTLTRRYKGAKGMAAFLRDFPGGRHTFYPRDFPGERRVLERMGVRFIRANYQLYGGSEILSGQASKSLPGQVPSRIARCWD